MQRAANGLCRLGVGRRLASTLVVAERDAAGLLNPATLSAVTAAKELKQPIHGLVLGASCGEASEAMAKAGSVEAVSVIESDFLKNGEAERTVPAILDFLTKAKPGEYSHVVFGSTAVAKNLIPRLAALMDVSPVTDIISISSEDTFVRPIYAGNALATVKSTDATKILSVRPTCFAVGETQDACTIFPVEVAAEESVAGMSEWVSTSSSSSDGPDLTSAKVVISGGRGLKNGENFEMLYKLAGKLQGAVGASRAAVDAGFVSNELQVGQTGKVVAPDLYVAVGISGAIQHLAGMKDSKCIVAINKDPEAPIFQVSDYGLVGDLFTLVPEFDAKV